LPGREGDHADERGYQTSDDLAEVIPVFPLPGALLLPRGQMPLNIFEPRYMVMIDDALRAGHRLIGMIQPDPAHPGPESKPNLYKVGCVGRITQLAETGDRRYLLQLAGIARFRIDEELTVATPYRQCRVSYDPFVDDFTARKGEERSTAPKGRARCRIFSKRTIQGRLEGIETRRTRRGSTRWR
jgi:Lon protease-like protein